LGRNKPHWRNVNGIISALLEVCARLGTIYTQHRKKGKYATKRRTHFRIIELLNLQKGLYQKEEGI